MHRRHGKLGRWVLVFMALVALSFYVAVNRSSRVSRARFYEQKVASARLARKAFLSVREARQRSGIPIDTVNDPNKTGLVGVQYSQLTYGRSDLSDALTSLSPNFSAALVEMLHEAGVKPGDSVGLSWDGTYPALNVQALAVVASLGLRPVIVTAASAGMWGANYPGWSWLDIERNLVEAGIWQYRSRFATLGGEADDGRGLSPEGRAVLLAAAESAGVECRIPIDLEQGVELRLGAFEGCRAVICLGKASADIGDPMARVPSRVLKKPVGNLGSGTIAALLDSRVPVTYIGNPSRVAADYGLPIAPVPLPDIGKGRLFFERRYSVLLAAVLSLVMLGLLWFVVRYDVEWYFGPRKPRADEEAV